MNVVIAAIGSRGDVVPFAHLAARFAGEGHDVTLITHEEFSYLIDASVRVVPVTSDPRALMAGPAARAVRRWSPRKLNQTRDLFAEFVHSAYEPARRALAGADVLIASTFAMAAVDAATQLSVPVIRAHMWPEYPGLGRPMPLVPYSWTVPDELRQAARRALRSVEQYLGGLDGWWERGRLHLVARHPVGLTTQTAGSLYAFSPLLVPAAPAGCRATGWWTGPDRERTLSEPVDRAVDDGDRWIYVGFGSMDQDDPAAVLQRVSGACDRAGVRAIVQLAGVRGQLHPNVLCVGEEPHDELFGRVAVAVHHGGAGTTAAAVRAGVPSVVVPHFADQFYWGHRLHTLGVGARPLPRAVATERALARSIGAALDPRMRARAQCLAERVAGEDGTGCAVRQVEQWLAGVRTR